MHVDEDEEDAAAMVHPTNESVEVFEKETKEKHLHSTPPRATTRSTEISPSTPPTTSAAEGKGSSGRKSGSSGSKAGVTKYASYGNAVGSPARSAASKDEGKSPSPMEHKRVADQASPAMLDGKSLDELISRSSEKAVDERIRAMNERIDERINNIMEKISERKQVISSAINSSGSGSKKKASADSTPVSASSPDSYGFDAYSTARKMSTPEAGTDAAYSSVDGIATGSTRGTPSARPPSSYAMRSTPPVAPPLLNSASKRSSPLSLSSDMLGSPGQRSNTTNGAMNGSESGVSSVSPLLRQSYGGGGNGTPNGGAPLAGIMSPSMLNSPMDSALLMRKRSMRNHPPAHSAEDVMDE